MRRVLALCSLIVVAAIWPPARAVGDTVATFDVTRGELPEGIAFDRHAAMYVSLAPLGEIRRRSADGSWSSFATVGPHSAGGLAILGLAIDPHGTVYAAAPIDSPEWHGVVMISDAGAKRRVPGTEQMEFPNALTFVPGGDLFVTDSAGGSIWRIPRRGPAGVWLEHASLAGTAVVNPFPLGANGIAYHRGSLYVTNTEKKQVVEIPIAHDGQPGAPRIVHAFTGSSDFLDGITVDTAGNLYVMKVADSELTRIDRCGGVTTLADASDGLNIPASLTFGARGLARQVLYITNLAAPNLTPTPNPAVIAVDVRQRDRHPCR